MKKLLLGTAALIAFAAPALAADLPARTYTKAPAYTAPEVVYNWTGFYIGGHVGGAFAGNNSLQGSDGRFMGGVQGGFDYQFATELGDRRRSPVRWLANNNNSGVLFPAGTADHRQYRPARLGHRPVRLHLGSGAALRQGRLCLARQHQYRRQPRPACRWPLPPTATTRTAIPSAPASNTCSRRTGPPRPNTSITISATPPSPAAPPEIVGARFRDDEHTVKVGVNYRFGWGGPVAAKY